MHDDGYKPRIPNVFEHSNTEFHMRFLGLTLKVHGQAYIEVNVRNCNGRNQCTKTQIVAL